MGQVVLAEPPVMPEPPSADLSSGLGFLPMALGVGSMGMMFSMSESSPTTYLMSGMMGTSMVTMGISHLGRGRTDRSRRARGERRDYLRYLAQVRRRVVRAGGEQRAALLWDNPDPAQLWSLALGPRLWERRAGHDDYGQVRVGLGTRKAALEIVPPETKPVEDLEPLSAISLRRFIHAYQTVAQVPVAVNLRDLTSVEFAGEAEAALGLARSIIGQLAVFHPPDELRIALLTDAPGLQEWQWLKWLPHNAHPTAVDAGGPLRLAATDYRELIDLLGQEFEERPDHDPQSVPATGEPLVVIAAYGAVIPPGARLLSGVRNAVLLDLTGGMPGGPGVLRVTVTKDRLEYPSGDAVAVGKPDSLSEPAAERLARTLSPMRTGSTVDLANKPLETDFDLTALLGIRNPHTFDVASRWRSRQPLRSRLQVPIGVTEDGEIVELNLRESAQGGMGPHGLLIGATGSGKSELLRTLVVSLAASHSSEILNFVLVDFKGGATFLNMDRLPHTSAVITNLADELPLVDRMQDALNGEVIRRQELLRVSGHASLFEYEKARLAGADLAPLPTLLLIVDEFSELLAIKPEFIELFVTIGRVGRSLGVHLLLASQRLDEGRIHRVEGHLSYRIGLRTFSAMESRAVIGVPSAYELPSSPGNGYLKIDTTNLVRFKAAYVSGPCAPVEEQSPDVLPASAAKVLSFGFEQDAEVSRVAPVVPGAVAAGAQETTPGPGTDATSETLLEVLVNRVAGAGPPARQVWLPPLASPSSLDRLLPSIVPDPARGLAAKGDRPNLRVPIGVVDRPYEQSRDLLIADLAGPDGHVAVAGAPQSGKSTVLRTLIMSLALTHTPEEVQFYCLDFGGGLASMAGLPHVGSVAARLDRDRVQRTVAELTQLVEEREQRFTSLGVESMAAYRALRARGEVSDPYGDVFLVIDGWGTLHQEFEAAEAKIGEIAARGLSFGVHVVVAAVRWSEIRPRIRDLLGTKLELRLGDPMESMLNSRAAGGVPRQPGRGLMKTGHHFLCGLPRLDGASTSDDLTVATKDAVAEIAAFWPGRRAPEVRLLPAVLHARDLPKPEGDMRMCLGWEEQRLQPAWHDFARTPHLLLMGDGETGKTNALRLVIKAVMDRYQPAQARILLGDPSRELYKSVPDEYRIGYAVDASALEELAKSAVVSLTARLPAADITPEQLERRDWWRGAQLFMVIDDYDLLAQGTISGGPLSPFVPLLGQAPYIGLHLVIARSTSGAMRAMMDPLLRRLWELGTPGLLFSYPKEEGKFLGEAKPRLLSPGRAQFVTRRDIGLIQTGLVGQA
jgi:S-DNA-T family DNA segregation ATPase FtsK/SpoIIIE